MVGLKIIDYSIVNVFASLIHLQIDPLRFFGMSACASRWADLFN